MRSPERPLDYLVAGLVAAAALGARAALQPVIGPMQPLAHGFVAVAAAVMFCGWRPAVLTAAISFVGGSYLFMHPDHRVDWASRQEIAMFIVYTMSAGIIIFLGHRAKRAEQELASANEQLRSADRKKDEFLAMLSHELRNPIGVITTAARVLDAGERDPQLRPTIAILLRQASQIGRLVDDLLDIGRITRGRLTLQLASHDLRKCVHDAADAHRDGLERKGQSLGVIVPAGPVMATVDYARMVQVVSNLIDNASKYSQERADIHVLLRAEDEVDLEVSDNGPGIPPETLPHVFDLFDQGGTAHASAGLGVGLGLCKRIVEMHGGTITALSNPRGRGTTFRIRLPQSVTSAAADEYAAANSIRAS
jgi:signal transduction histidine kinase